MDRLGELSTRNVGNSPISVPPIREPSSPGHTSPDARPQVPV